jgi:hypothetical protein
MTSEWTNVEDALPEHMQEVRVYVEDPYFGSFERNRNAVYLGFTGDFYDSEEQIHLDYITKWRPLDKEAKESRQPFPLD